MRVLTKNVRDVVVAVLLLGTVFLLGCASTESNTLTGGVLAVDGVREWVGCAETDKELGSGRSPFKAGTTTVEFIRGGSKTVETLTRPDECLSSRNLREFHCIGKKLYREEIDCKSFGQSFRRTNTCQNNACVPQS